MSHTHNLLVFSLNWYFDHEKRKIKSSSKLRSINMGDTKIIIQIIVMILNASLPFCPTIFLLNSQNPPEHLGFPPCRRFYSQVHVERTTTLQTTRPFATIKTPKWRQGFVRTTFVRFYLSEGLRRRHVRAVCSESFVCPAWVQTLSDEWLWRETVQ